LWRCYLARLST
jgi:hypothetical protein